MCAGRGITDDELGVLGAARLQNKTARECKKGTKKRKQESEKRSEMSLIIKKTLLLPLEISHRRLSL